MQPIGSPRRARSHRARAEWEAVWRLVEENPEQSAYFGVTAIQKSILLAAAIVFIAFISFDHLYAVQSLSALASVLFVLISLYRLALITCALLRHEASIGPTTHDEEDLPAYTILVPLYREGSVVPELIDALRAIDYPRSKLDIKLILEHDDVETFRAIPTTLPDEFDIVIVPSGPVRTKPRACNYAVAFAKGRYVVIYDAEDRPEPDQLRRAATIFDQALANGDKSLACVQAHLNYYNPHENWLTRQFALEYSLWFDLLLPGLTKAGLPIPLGGTSNHFRVDVLKQTGAWDAHNVTEDADLGIRLAKTGYRCRMMASTTLEEANCQLGNWIRQRSRWMKGYLQTYFVHMRRPRELLKSLGWGGFAAIQLFVGGTVLSALAYPIVCAALAVEFFAGGSAVLLHASCFVIGQLIFVAAGGVAAARRGEWRLVFWAATLPLYWGLMSVAAYRAIRQLWADPFAWEKTQHGLSRMQPKTS